MNRFPGSKYVPLHSQTSTLRESRPITRSTADHHNLVDSRELQHRQPPQHQLPQHQPEGYQQQLPDAEFSIQDLSQDWNFPVLFDIPIIEDDILLSSMLYGEPHTNTIPSGRETTPGLPAPTVSTAVAPVEKETTEDASIVADSSNGIVAGNTYRSNTTFSPTTTKDAHSAANPALPHPDPIRQHACSHCPSRFAVSKDRDRHVRTIHHQHNPNDEVWICRETPCKRKGKQFSRRDNYLKHLRKVHGVQEEEKRGSPDEPLTSRRRVSSEGKSESAGDSTLVSESEGANIGVTERRGKRKADVLEDDELEEASKEELLGLVLEMRRKCRKLEEDLQVQTRRHTEREDMWYMSLKLLSERLGSAQ